MLMYSIYILHISIYVHGNMQNHVNRYATNEHESPDMSSLNRSTWLATGQHGASIVLSAKEYHLHIHPPTVRILHRAHRFMCINLMFRHASTSTLYQSTNRVSIETSILVQTSQGLPSLVSFGYAMLPFSMTQGAWELHRAKSGVRAETLIAIHKWRA